MSENQLTRYEIDRIVKQIQNYFDSELGQDIGGFEAEFLLDFIAQQIGSHYYNRGLSAAHAVFIERTEELSYLIQELEQPIS